MPLSLNEIKDRALAFSREWEGANADRQSWGFCPLRLINKNSLQGGWQHERFGVHY